MRKFILLLMVVFLLVSCSSKAPKKTENPVDLYVAGVDLMKKKKYDDAVKKFTAIREQYPFDPMALVAAVKLGDTYFLKKDYVLATSTYEDYFKAHPDEENIPYVLFKLGECYEKLSPSADRDQANTIKGIERITYLRNRYPASQYAAESEGRLKAFIQKLADRELYIGEFYVKTAQYNGAIMRLEPMLKQYPDSKNIDRALFYLYDAHRQLGNQEKADQYLQTLRTKYPKSLYARATIRERKSLKITQVQPGKPGEAPDAVKKPAPAQKPAQAPPEAQAPAPVPIAATPGILQAPEEVQEIPSVAIPMAASSGTTPEQAATTPKTSQYTERPKKVIDLRPPEQPAAPAQPAPAPVTVKAPAPSAETPKGPVSETPKASAAPKAPVPAAATPKAPPAQATLKPAEPAKTGETEKPKTEKPETGKTSDKKLGFLDQKKPIDIVSDTMEGFDKEKYVLFKGNVVAKQDDLYIYSDNMEAYMSADTNEIDRANAKGHVRIIKQNRTATSQEAYFDNVKGEILLKGDAVVTSDKDRVEGDEVTYYVNEDRAVVTAEKTKKAKVTIYPKQK
jgi:outer membrane protein assembly factor BamD